MIFSLLVTPAAALVTYINNVPVNYASNGVSSFNRIVIAMPGKEDLPSDMVDALTQATYSAGCDADTLIISPDVSSSPYNLIERQLAGSLTLPDILDGIIANLGQNKTAIYAGFSKGSQAIQRYSLLTRPNQPGKTRYILGCASSFSFLDDTVSYRYGTANFPYPIPDVEFRVATKNSYRFICGSRDITDIDNSPEATAQGDGRVARATNLNNLHVALGIDSAIKIVRGVGHDEARVMSQSGEFICSI